MAETTRRRLVVACISGVTVALAGCADSGTGIDGTTGDDSDGTDSDAVTTSEGADDDETATEENANPSTESEATGGGQLGETVSFAESYAMTATMQADQQTIEMAGRFHEGDLYWEFTQQGQRMEWYLVGNESYFVSQGQCFSGSFQGGLNRGDVDPRSFSEDADENPDLEPVGRDTIEGDEVLVYELSGSEGAPSGETVTFYVLADSGYLRRIESDSMQWDFHSWGEVEPVEAPSGNCQSMPTGTSTGE